MGKLQVNGAIEATSHISIKNGADLYLSAPSSTPDDSGDLVFTKYDGTEQGRIWISGGIGMIRFSSSDSSKTLIHSGNIGSQSVNYANSAGAITWSGITGKPSTFIPSSHNHTSLTGITSLDFSAHSDDGASIKTTINDTVTYLDFNLLDDGETDSFRWNFGRWDNTTSSQQNVVLMTLTCAQNANTAKLIVNGTIQGNLDWNYVTNKPSTFTPSSHNHSSLSALIIDDNLAYNAVGTDSGGGVTYEKGLLSALCSRYPGYGGNFSGRYWPNSYGFLLGNIYNTSDISNGLPRYSTFIGCNLQDTPRIFGTYNYNQYSYRILNENNYSLWCLPLSGGTMTGTITLAARGFQTNAITGYYTDEYGNFYHSNTASTSYWNIFNNAGTMSLKYYYETGVLIAPRPTTTNYGGTLPSSGVTGEIFYKT